MSIPFEMVGKLTISKETEKFKPYSENSYPSGWVNRQLLFNVICGDNRHMLQIKGGSFADGHGDVHLFSKNSIDEGGKKIKGEKFKIPFKERLTSPKLAECAEFKKFVIDLEIPNRRYLLEKAAEKVKEGTSLTDEELKVLEIESESEITTTLEESKKKHHEFVTEWDFAEFVKKVLDSDKYKNKKFKIIGEIDHSYSDQKQKIYENITPRRIYLAKDDAEEYSTATVDFFYNKESLDDGSLEEKGKYYINGYTFFYDSNRKKNLPTPVTIVLHNVTDDVDEKTKKVLSLYLGQFKVDDDSWKQLGVIINMINGAQKVEIDESMLTEFQQDLLLCGEITLDDIRKEMGGAVYGDRVQEYQFVKPAKGFSKGRQDTVFIDDDMVIKPLETELPEGTKDLFEDESEEDDDL